MAICSCTEPDKQGPPPTWPMFELRRELSGMNPFRLKPRMKVDTLIPHTVLHDNSFINITTSAANKKRQNANEVELHHTRT